MTAHKVVPFRRKRQRKTDYRLRLKILLSRKPRAVIRKSVSNIVVQIVEYDPKGDRVLAASSTAELRKKGWKFNTGNVVSAYLTGILAGKKAAGKGIREAVVDLGNQKQGLRLYAAIKGVIDAGINIPCKKDVLPAEDVVAGARIKAYARKLREENKERYEKQFSAYQKAGLNIEDIGKSFERIKNVK